MASRTSTNVTMGVLVTIFGILTLALFVTTLLFFSQKNNVQNTLNQLQAEQDQYIRASETSSQRVQEALGQKQNNESLVNFLLTQNRELKALAVGSADVDLATARQRASERGGVANGSMLSRIESLQAENAALTQQRDEERRLRLVAQADASAANDRVGTIDQSRQAAVAAATGNVDEYRRGVEGYRDDAGATADEMRALLAEERGRLTAEIREREDRIAELNNDLLVQRDLVRRLRGEGEAQTLAPLDEYALVDGSVVGIEPLDDSVIISLVADDKLVLGMTFSVYASAANIRPDLETGEYSPGKAIIEVIRIEEGNARCRVVRQQVGNPPVRGDIIASPFYDPEKTYAFVVEGHFDTDRDGAFTPFERDDLAGLITRWGGVIHDGIQGDTDFLVIGRRPELPPAPPADAPLPVVENFVRLQQAIARYDRRFQQAADTGIPVLNENRLRTLIGDLPVD